MFRRPFQNYQSWPSNQTWACSGAQFGLGIVGHLDAGPRVPDF